MLAQPEPTRVARGADHMVDLLLAIAPLLHILRGDKRAFLHRAFVNAALFNGSVAMDIDEGRLPVNARDAALALHRASLDLAQRAGVSRVELTDDYNDHGEKGSFENGGVDEAAKRCLALLAVFHARRVMGLE